MRIMKLLPKPHRFLATIYKIWMLRYVDVPEDVGRSLKKQYARRGSAARKVKGERGKYIPVVAMVNGQSTRTTLVPAGGGRYRLQFNATLRKAARADVGEVVGVAVELDRQPRDLPIPPELKTALRRRSILRREFERLPPGQRHQFLLYLRRAKGVETRRKRLERLIEVLLERGLLRQPKRGRGRRSPA
jgi:bacteriocin resistance YdeI/OmpD-like protein/uncharacterized protein DUF1905